MPHPEPERVLVLEQWLREHGQHDDDFCGKNDWPDNDCECGLEALLASRAGVRPMTSPRQEPRDSADPEAVAGLREALRRLDDLAENQAYALNVRCVIHDIASDFRAALRDRAGVPPPQDRAGLGEVAASAEVDLLREAVALLWRYPTDVFHRVPSVLAAWEKQRQTFLSAAASSTSRPAPVPLARAPLDRPAMRASGQGEVEEAYVVMPNGYTRLMRRNPRSMYWHCLPDRDDMEDGIA